MQTVLINIHSNPPAVSHFLSVMDTLNQRGFRVSHTTAGTDIKVNFDCAQAEEAFSIEMAKFHAAH